MIAVDRLPREIRESTRAVVWRHELRDGRRTKVPYQPQRPAQRAAVDNPATWGRFDQALAVVAAGKADGPGIVLGAGLIGVDLDHVRAPDTGAITAEALAIVRALDPYREAPRRAPGAVDPDDAGLLERARAARNGVKFDALWRGDWYSLGYPSQSEADLALCNLLAWSTRWHAERVDRLFRQSGLMRAKWDARCGEQTYGERTIATAIAGGSR